MTVRTRKLVCFAITVMASVWLLGLAVVSPSFAASAWWHLSSGSRPTYLQPESQGQIVLSLANLGDANADGKTLPVTIVDKLPAGFKAISIKGVAGDVGSFDSDNRGSVVCVLTTLTCTFAGTLPPYDVIEVRIGVEATVSASSGEVNEASVSGAGVQSATVRHPVTLSEEQTPFGVEEYELSSEEEGGASTTQAGAHPFQLTTTIGLNQTFESTAGVLGVLPAPAALVKDLHFNLPAGLIGNPTPFPRCTLAQFLKFGNGGFFNGCPSQTVLGVANVTVIEPLNVGLQTFGVPVFNIEPAVGEPARFAFAPAGVPVYLDAAVRTSGDYGVTVNVSNITQIAGFLRSEVTFWGVPGDPSHDNSRGYGCLLAQRDIHLPGEPPSCTVVEQHNPPPFLALPTACTGPLQTSVEADSWKEPSNVLSFGPSEALQALDGCNRLPFSPLVKVTPDGQAASTPTGLTVDVHVPQDSVLVAKGLAESNVKDISVTLPEGVALNPAGADGLEACSESQVGFRAGESTPGHLLFTDSVTEPFCPDASKVGTVDIASPLLPETQHLKGAVYLASQDQNPFGSLVALYIVAQDPISGVLVKLSGEVSLSPTGQITGIFRNTPRLAFEDAELHFFGGERAPLATPAHCGAYTTTASFAPWSGGPPADPSSTFNITSGPDGSPCADPLPFDPELTAGSTNIQAGAFSPFTMTMSRQDGNQNLQAIQLKMPPGLSGTLSRVKLCDQADANAGTCGPESLIGETVVSVGLGGDPFSVRGGKVYITEGYEGASYGLSIVNPAKAGPFDLGQVVVRAKIEVDPITAALTVTTDKTGPFAIPQIIDGIPLQIKHVNVTVTRTGGFTFNPTNCDPTAITGSLTSSQGTISALSVPFQATNCATLAFKPIFKVSTAGKTSRTQGASLHVLLAYPKAPFGTQANIRSVKVDLPKQLPSRLTTLQKACPDSVFNQDPAACPATSRVGMAVATTPLIPVSLSGPAYFVSHGGLKFPELVIVLSGYGVTVQLHGETFISKAGITSSTFRTVPDVPVGTFELTLPQGKGSALAANGNLCTSKLKMPTTFTAQNGMVVKQSTPVAVTGCPKKKPKKASKHHKGQTHGKKR